MAHNLPPLVAESVAPWRAVLAPARATLIHAIAGPNSKHRVKGGVTEEWLVRPEALPIKEAVVIETKGYTSGWRKLEFPWWILKDADNPMVRGIEIDGTTYLGCRMHNPEVPGHLVYQGYPPRPAHTLQSSKVTKIERFNHF